VAEVAEVVEEAEVVPEAVLQVGPEVVGVAQLQDQSDPNGPSRTHPRYRHNHQSSHRRPRPAELWCTPSARDRPQKPR
jgi:hypothetical protein